MHGLSSESLIHQYVEAQVLATPDAIALLFENTQLTYQELNQKANQVSHYLKQSGVKPDQVVGVCLERSCEMVIALLGILKAGGAYLPLDPSYPADRLAFMLTDSQAPVLLTQTDLAQKFPNPAIQVVCLDADATTIAQHATHNLALEQTPDQTPDQLAYVIYTSGSTGQPKGVAMPHRALVNLLLWQQDLLPLHVGSRTLQFTPISFDVSFQEIFSTLIAGGTLVLVPDTLRRDALQLLHFLQEQEIERLFLPFVALRQLAEIGARKAIYPPALRDVITAGEQLRITPAIATWFNQMPDCALHNHYGPSESHVVTAFTLQSSPYDWPILPPIGYPIANTQIYILDTDLNPVPEGIGGELYIGGSGLARGYLHRPTLTAERFISHPLHPQSGERLYKTGDLAQWLPDGSLEYLGRIDQQVKIRGFRIEPGEIAALLEHHPEVREAVVVVHETESGDARLVAYIVPAQDLSPSIRELRQFLKARLPDYMIPAAFMILDAFPLTPSGKTDQRALPTPTWTPLESSNYVAPRTPLETKLAEIWSHLLDVEPIGIHDTFCDLGGHSLLAVRLLTEISETFHWDLSLEDLFAIPTIAKLAVAIETLQKHQENQQRINLEADGELDATIQPTGLPSSHSIQEIFLTGATGFLGAFLLHELLQRSSATLHCLVRTNRPEEGKARIAQNLRRYQLWDESFSARIIPVLGDLSQLQCGIQPSLFDHLAETIDAIYHCGALVNMIYPYSLLKAVNVVGTQEVLRLACQTRTKPVHFISTIDVFASIKQTGTKTVHDQTAIGPGEDLYSGYAQSKYVAEKLVMAAASRGLPIAIYRPSNIIGHSQTGVCQTEDFIALMLKGCIQMGMAPELDLSLNLVPVDYVSQATVALANHRFIEGRSLNLVNPRSLTWQEFIQAVIRRGYPLQLVSYETWYENLQKGLDQAGSNVLTDLIPILANPLFVVKLLGGLHFEGTETMDWLRHHPVVCASVSDDVLQTYVSFLVESGFLPSPSLNAYQKALVFQSAQFQSAQ